MNVGDPITVLKLNLTGRVTWQYEGRVTLLAPDRLELEARFDRADLPFQGVLLKRGDLFHETFYFDRWYNIFAIYDRDDGALKGWYCNISYPATTGKRTVSFVDLGLDLWVAADGAQQVLDEEEFAALPLRPEERARALDALRELQARFANQNAEG